MAVRIPFEFVLDELAPLAPRVRAMFGAHAIYVEDKMVLIVREKEQDPDDGVWLATSREHHHSLREQLPSIRSIGIFGSGVTSWQIIPASAPEFEREVIRACELVLHRDPRIGKVPAPKKTSRVRAKAPSEQAGKGQIEAKVQMNSKVQMKGKGKVKSKSKSKSKNKKSKNRMNRKGKARLKR